MEKERRIIGDTLLKVEKRAEGEGERDYFVGCAVKFGVRSQNLGGFIEIIDANAFAECDMTDVVGLINHDSNIILGRTLAGTLTLELRAGDGVYFVIPVDTEDTDHLRYRRKIEKGEIRGCSFQFEIPDNSLATEWDFEHTPYLRTIKKIKKLYDVGPVTFPAYLQTDTSVASRALETAKADHDRILAEQRQAEEQQATPPFTGIPLSTYQRRVRGLQLAHRN
jgi:HK97 family phage prohead protease